MNIGRLGGFQIAFLIGATALLFVPLAREVSRMLALDEEASGLLARFGVVAFIGVVFIAIPKVRSACLARLGRGIASEDRTEVVIASLLYPLHILAWAGACVLWWHFAEGPVALEQHVLAAAGAGRQGRWISDALRPATLVTYLVLAVALGPIIEELLFREFLFKAWEARFGWFVAMMMMSTVFAALHPRFWVAFLGSTVYLCVYRRTGSLWSAIAVHATTNLMVMYPLLGRWAYPAGLPDPGDLRSWTFHVACLFALMVAWPAYLWMSRDRADEPIVIEEDHVALPR